MSFKRTLTATHQGYAKIVIILGDKNFKQRGAFLYKIFLIDTNF